MELDAAAVAEVGQYGRGEGLRADRALLFLTRLRDNGDGRGVQAGCEEPCAVSSAFLAIAP